MALSTNNQTIPRNNTTLPPVPQKSSGASPVVPPTPALQPTSNTMPTPQGGHVAIRPLRTYKDDLAEAIKRSGSADSVRRAAQPPQPQRTASVPPPRPAVAPPRPVAPPLPPVQPSAPVVKQAPPPPPVKQTAPPKPPVQTQDPVPPTPVAAQPPVAKIPSAQTGGKRLFFEQLLSHKREAPQSAPVALPHKETAAPTPPPVAKQVPPPAPPKPVAPPPPLEHPPSLPPLDPRVRFLEEHAVASPRFLGGGALPSWAMPGETAGERAAEQQEKVAREFAAAEALKPKPYTGPIVTHEAPTYGSAVIQTTPPQNTLRVGIAVIAVILLLGSVGGGGYLWFKNYQSKTNPSGDLQSTPFISATETVAIDATSLPDNALFTAYRSAEQEPLANQAIRAITPTITEKDVTGANMTRALRAEEFLDRVARSAPGSFTRSLGDRFASGAYGSIEGNNGFLIFGINDHDRALSGLLSWEPRMGTDLAPLLLVNTIYPAIFSDTTIGGVAVRRVGIGEKALVYGVTDNNILLVTRGEGTFKVLLSLTQTP